MGLQVSVYLHLGFLELIFPWDRVNILDWVSSTHIGSQTAGIVSVGAALLLLSLGSYTLTKIPTPHLRVEFRDKTNGREMDSLQESESNAC